MLLEVLLTKSSHAMRERRERFFKTGGSFRPTWSYANVILTAPEDRVN